MSAAKKVTLGLLFFLALDALLFRSGLYWPYLEPDSSAGILQLTLLRERAHQAAWKEPLVLTMGDSRMNYSPKLVNEFLAAQGWNFRLTHGGVAGTTPRCWHYILRELDPTARRYHAIVFPVDSFDDLETDVDYRDYPYDIQYLTPLLRWQDLPEYPLTYATREWAAGAWRATLVKGAALQPDILSFLRNPRERIRKAQLNRSWWPNGSYEYLESEKNVNGLAVDWSTRTPSYPPEADAAFKEAVTAMLLRPRPPSRGIYSAYRRLWFGKIRERYRNSPTRLIVVKLPRGPLVRPSDASLAHTSSLRDLGFEMGDEHRYEILERTELFKDVLHMNRAGSTRYGQMLAEELKAKLAL